MNKCTRCKKEKPIIEFVKSLYTKTGYINLCKKCHTEYQKQWEEKNPLYKKQWVEKIEQKYGIGIRTIQTYGLQLALLVYDRAKRECEQCGESYDLTIHHKDGNGRNNQEKRLPMNNHTNNLQVLCRKCHGSIHGKEGRGISRRLKKGGDKDVYLSKTQLR